MTFFLFWILFDVLIACQGRSPDNPSSYFHRRILGPVGTRVAQIEDNPYYVSLMYENRMICGGTAVSNRYIITSQNCVVHHNNTHKYKVRYCTNKSDTYIIKTGGKMRVKNIILCPWYDDTLDYDVALIELKKPLHTSKCFKSIPIAKLSDYPSVIGPYGKIMGLGETDSFTSDVLKENKVRILTKETCQAYHNYNIVLTPRQFCAITGFTHGMGGACGIDAGGPLIYNNRLLGIISHRYGHCMMDLPSVFVNVTSLIFWLKKYIKI